MTGPLMRMLEALAFSGLWPAAVAAALTAACGLALAPSLEFSRFAAMVGLAFAGTVVVYDVDRLRDVRRDRTNSPARSRFVVRNRPLLKALTVAAALACLPLALRQSPWVWPLCGGVLGLGLMHRRLKEGPALKVAYVTFSWLAVVVGMPVANAIGAGLDRIDAAWCAGICGAAIAANLIVSDLRDEGTVGQRKRLRVAIMFAALATALPLLAGARPWPLVAIAAAELASLAGFRAEERYGLVVVDGALLAGALAAIALLQAS